MARIKRDSAPALLSPFQLALPTSPPLPFGRMGGASSRANSSLECSNSGEKAGHGRQWDGIADRSKVVVLLSASIDDYLVPRPSWPSGSGFRRRTVWYRVEVFPCRARTLQGKILHKTSTLVHFVATITPLYYIFNI